MSYCAPKFVWFPTSCNCNCSCAHQLIVGTCSHTDLSIWRQLRTGGLDFLCFLSTVQKEDVGCRHYFTSKNKFVTMEMVLCHAACSAISSRTGIQRHTACCKAQAKQTQTAPVCPAKVSAGNSVQKQCAALTLQLRDCYKHGACLLVQGAQM